MNADEIDAANKFRILQEYVARLEAAYRDLVESCTGDPLAAKEALERIRK